MTHSKPHPLVGKRVEIDTGSVAYQLRLVPQPVYTLIDWWDRVVKEPFNESRYNMSHEAAIHYTIQRRNRNKYQPSLPPYPDDEHDMVMLKSGDGSKMFAAHATQILPPKEPT